MGFQEKKTNKKQRCERRAKSLVACGLCGGGIYCKRHIASRKLHFIQQYMQHFFYRRRLSKWDLALMLIVTSCVHQNMCAFEMNTDRTPKLPSIHQKSSSFWPSRNSVHNTHAHTKKHTQRERLAIIVKWFGCGAFFSLSRVSFSSSFWFFVFRKFIVQNGNETHWTLKRALWSTTPFIIASGWIVWIDRKTCLYGSKWHAIYWCAFKTTPNLCSRCQSITSQTTHKSINIL